MVWIEHKEMGLLTQAYGQMLLLGLPQRLTGALKGVSFQAVRDFQSLP
jgi:hypothetical protein